MEAELLLETLSNQSTQAANSVQKVNVLVAQASLTLRSYGLWSTRLLCPWNSPDKNIGVGSHSLLQGIFPIQGLTQISHTAGRFITT